MALGYVNRACQPPLPWKHASMCIAITACTKRAGSQQYLDIEVQLWLLVTGAPPALPHADNSEAPA